LPGWPLRQPSGPARSGRTPSSLAGSQGCVGATLAAVVRDFAVAINRRVWIERHRRCEMRRASPADRQGGSVGPGRLSALSRENRGSVSPQPRQPRRSGHLWAGLGTSVFPPRNARGRRTRRPGRPSGAYYSSSGGHHVNVLPAAPFLMPSVGGLELTSWVITPLLCLLLDL
jgi:hypothetical protein